MSDVLGRVCVCVWMKDQRLESRLSPSWAVAERDNQKSGTISFVDFGTIENDVYTLEHAPNTRLCIGAAAPDIIITRLQSSIWWLEMSGSLGPIHTAAIQRRERAIYYRTHQHNHLI